MPKLLLPKCFKTHKFFFRLYDNNYLKSDEKIGYESKRMGAADRGINYTSIPYNK